MKGKGRCTLLMHPDDMAMRDISDGDPVTVSSRVGSVTVAVEATDDMMPGVVSLPHGFGHNREGTRLGIAHEHAGVSCNDITDELAIDALSGNAAVNGVLVSVAPA
jgi:anaerobic selenocysteine-containing dehydrogenase